MSKTVVNTINYTRYMEYAVKSKDFCRKLEVLFGSSIGSMYSRLWITTRCSSTNLLVSSRFIVRYVAAYLLAVIGGNETPAAADLTKILSSVGIEVDAARVTKIIGELKGKSIEELIKQGREKLSSMPVGGAAAAAPAAGKFELT